MDSAPVTRPSLLAKIAHGADAGAWIEFHDRYAGLILGVARRAGLQQADADDVLQEVLLALSQQMADFEYDPSRGRFRGFLQTVTIRAVLKRLRQNRRQPLQAEVEDVALSMDDTNMTRHWEQEWQQHQLTQAMRRLESEFNEADRAAFSQYVIAGRPAADTASGLGLSVEQVYQAKSRMLRRLREIMAEQEAPQGAGHE